ncbi:hypothetical protein SAMN04489735_10766 [Aneurinibacillus thermoaerophilus]|uniref:Uncharacterized protein n=1 Tax=Aneurinibacillus thermoaerophilus TaxID=143495 RepID=A0A1G8FQ69_ANETH|nr:hypothetical protein [Aneurinibacillus thermoaerophilus]MED0676951.1 hypothetical protein [Aneurinibacillus thermoaerophilus]SDH84066.1 hypothetical protein SAMN04489735_10766 [Aneurinibacillus thermoaerophilus]
MEKQVLQSLKEQFDLLQQQSQVAAEAITNGYGEPEHYRFLVGASLAMVQIANEMNGYLRFTRKVNF